MSRGCQVTVRFCPPPAELAPYFTSFYLTEMAMAEGVEATDYLHPEWGNLRFHSGGLVEAQSGAGTQIGATDFSATGPSSKALRFTVRHSRLWGVGLLPLGWAKFIGEPAAALADAVVDGHTHPAFASFRDLAASVFGEEPDPEAELTRITEHFLARLDEPVTDEARIQALHAALVDRDTGTVAELASRVGASSRTIERICQRAFGFSPKLLLRRQRFMRSLVQYMLDPSLTWIGALDGHYHDQAQFVREFREFMGMAPSHYAGLEHPILDAIVAERARIAGSAVQALDGPRGGSRHRIAPTGLK